MDALENPINDGAANRILVIGAGIVGVSAALALRREGLAVTLVDRARPGEGASFGNAGLLAASSNVPVNTPGLIRRAIKMLADPLPPLYLRWRYLPRLAPWLLAYIRRADSATAATTAAHIDVLIHDCLDQHRALARGTKAAARIRSMPSLFAYPGRQAYEADAFGWSLRRAAGWQWTVLTGAAVRELEPDLAPRYDCLAVFENHHGIVSEPGAYVKDLAEAFVECGGELIQASVRDFDFIGGRPVAAITDQGRLPFQTAVIAAGAWSARLTAKLGIKIPLEAERGYHLEIKDPSVRPRHSIQIFDGKCVATPMDHALRIAGLVEFGGLEAGPATRPAEVLAARAKALLPALEYSEHSEWLGHRPATIDSLPVIGPTLKYDNIHLGFGHGHVGLTGGPRTGRLIADRIIGRRPNIDMSPYRPERFD